MSCGIKDENNDVCGETFTCGRCRANADSQDWKARAKKAEARVAELEKLCLEAAKQTHNEMFGKDDWVGFTPDCLPDLIGWLWADRTMCVTRWQQAERELAEAKKIIERWTSPGPTPEEQSLDPEVVRQELRDLGVDDEEQKQISIRGKTFVKALIANHKLRQRLEQAEASAAAWSAFIDKTHEYIRIAQDGIERGGANEHLTRATIACTDALTMPRPTSGKALLEYVGKLEKFFAMYQHVGGGEVVSVKDARKSLRGSSTAGEGGEEKNG